MSKKTFHKAAIIYDRLRNEYDDYNSMAEFAQVFGLSRQALNERKRKDSVDYDEIIKLFPDVNRDWLFSEDEHVLRHAPLKKNFPEGKSSPFTGQHPHYSIDELLKEERSRLGISDIPDTEQGRVLQDALDDAVSTVLKLRRLIEMEKKKS